MFQAMPPVFAGLNAADSQDAARHLQQIDVPAGQAIMMEGESDQTLAFIAKGSVEVWMGETRVGTSGAREMIGEMELFFPMTRVCSVTAAHDTTLQILTPEAFRELCDVGNPVVYNIERFAIRRLSDRLSALNVEIAGRLQGGIRLKIDRSEPGLLRKLFGSRRDTAPDVEPLEVLKKSEMFSWANQTFVELLVSHFDVVKFEKDHVICEQGDDGDEMWIIGAGEVEIVLVTDASDDSGEVIGQLGPGHAFGDGSIVMNAERTATCVARSPVTALRMKREKYLELHELNDHVGSTFRQGIIRNLVIQLLATTRRYVALQPTLAPSTTEDSHDVWR